MSKRKDDSGKVVFGKTKFIDTDSKPRRRYVVVKDDGQNVKVTKLASLKSFDKDGKNANPDFVEIKPSYPGLNKRTGAFNRMYGKNRVTKEPLSLGKGNGVFDERTEFVLDDEDLEKVRKNISKAKTARRKKFRGKKKGK